MKTTTSKCSVLYSKCNALYELFYGSPWSPGKQTSPRQTLRRCLDILEAINGQPPSPQMPLEQLLWSIHTCTMNIRSLVMGSHFTPGASGPNGVARDAARDEEECDTGILTETPSRSPKPPSSGTVGVDTLIHEIDVTACFLRTAESGCNIL